MTPARAPRESRKQQRLESARRFPPSHGDSAKVGPAGLAHVGFLSATFRTSGRKGYVEILGSGDCGAGAGSCRGRVPCRLRSPWHITQPTELP